MDKVEGILKKLNLSEVEGQGIGIGWKGSGKGGVVEPQAVGKLLWRSQHSQMP
jgi:hypothetical protein